MENIEKNPELWELAKKRASFKKSLIVYIAVNTFLWLLWYFTEKPETYNGKFNTIPWPLWSTLGWGLGIALKFASAYIAPKALSAEEEYKKLINKN